MKWAIIDDHQECKIEMTVDTLSEATVRLVADQVFLNLFKCILAKICQKIKSWD